MRLTNRLRKLEKLAPPAPAPSRKSIVDLLDPADCRAIMEARLAAGKGLRPGEPFHVLGLDLPPDVRGRVQAAVDQLAG